MQRALLASPAGCILITTFYKIRFHFKPHFNIKILFISGNPEATLILDGVSFPVNIKTEGARMHRATFTPAESGNYKLRVKWAGKEVRGSPFSVLVSSVADASQVVCSGEGLRMGTVGKEIRSFLDTRRAGPGELTAQCVGPNKVAYCELYDHGDGTFTLNVKPQEAGKHALSIKYGGECRKCLN